MLNLFIDTSAVYTDPFWKRNFSSAILELAADELINIYISDLVIKELKKGYESELNENLEKIDKAKIILDKYSRLELNYTKPDINVYLEDFNSFYEEIFKIKNIVNLPINQNIFDDIIERSLYERKPFTDKKSEFRDAVIWVSYFEYAKKENLDNCILLSNNKHDFYEKDKLHPHLINDYDRFEAFYTFEDLHKAKKENLQNPVKELKEFINSVGIDDEFIIELIEEYENAEIIRYAHSEVQEYDPSLLLNSIDSSSVWGGYADLDEIFIEECYDIDVSFIGIQAIISGILLVDVGIDLYSYNSIRDDGEDKFPFYGTINRKAEIYFNFLFDESKVPFQFEITDFILK